MPRSHKKADDNVVRVDFARRAVLGPDGSERIVPDLGSDGAGSGGDPIRLAVADPQPAGRRARLVDGSRFDESKLECFSRLVDAGLVLVTLDTRLPAVVVPAKLLGMLQVHLSFSHRFRVADFAYDDLGIRGTLSFDVGPFTCVIPWNAVYAMSSEVLDERRVFPESFPAELLAMLPALGRDEEE